jgi:hypothetical protein
VGESVIALGDMGAAMAGGRELSGPVEVESFGQAVAMEDVVEDRKAAVEGFLVEEEAPERLAGGVVGGKDEDERELGPVGSEPVMGATIEEEEFTEAGTARTTAAMLALGSVAALGRDPGSPEPTSDGLAAEFDLVVLFEGFGKVTGIVERVFPAVKTSTCSRKSAGRAFEDCRPRLPWVMPVPPRVRTLALRRKTWRLLRASIGAAALADRPANVRWMTARRFTSASVKTGCCNIAPAYPRKLPEAPSVTLSLRSYPLTLSLCIHTSIYRHLTHHRGRVDW